MLTKIKKLAKKEKQYKDCLDLQTKNKFYIDEIYKLKMDKQRLEHTIRMEGFKNDK